MWYNEWGQEFETKEEAMADCEEKWNEYCGEEQLYEMLDTHTNINYIDIVRWAIKQPNFMTDFSKDIELAKKDFFGIYFYEAED